MFANKADLDSLPGGSHVRLHCRAFDVTFPPGRLPSVELRRGDRGPYFMFEAADVLGDGEDEPFA